MEESCIPNSLLNRFPPMLFYAGKIIDGITAELSILFQIASFDFYHFCSTYGHPWGKRDFLAFWGNILHSPRYLTLLLLHLHRPHPSISMASNVQFPLVSKIKAKHAFSVSVSERYPEQDTEWLVQNCLFLLYFIADFYYIFFSLRAAFLSEGAGEGGVEEEKKHIS